MLYTFYDSSEPAVIAKSNIILDVKPWDDETDMSELEASVRSVQTDGLLWGTCKYSFREMLTYEIDKSSAV